MNITRLKQFRVDAVARGVGAHPGKRGLHRFLHHRAELPCHDQPFTAARHAARLDKQHVAAHRRPSQTHGNAGPPRALGNFDVGPEPRRAQKLLHALRRDFRALSLAFGDAARALAADAAYFPFQASHAGFTRIAANQMPNGFIGEVNTLAFEPVLLHLPGNQIPESDDRFLLLGVALELDDLHAVA